MAFKSILTVLTDAGAAGPQIESATALARKLDAHLDVLCLGIDHVQTGYYYVGAAPIAPVMVQETLDQARDSARGAEAEARRRLSGEDIRWAIDTAIAQVGAIGPEVGRLARFSDLVLAPLPYAKGESPEQEQIVEAALFDGRSPVIAMPPAHFGKDWGSRVVIAWNQSDEAMTAVRASLPFLKAAASVNVAVIAPPSHGAERSDPGGMLSQFLSRHGVRTEVSVLARTLPHVSEQLCRHVEDLNADLIVMGAYGHSRFREAVLGGTTRELFEIAPVPVFAAH